MTNNFVSRGILTPTKTKTINKSNSSNKNQYDNVCRDRDIPTYGFVEAFRRKFYFIPTLFNGAMAIAPYDFLINLKHYNLTHLPLHTIENGKEISTQREVDEEKLKQIIGDLFDK